MEIGIGWYGKAQVHSYVNNHAHAAESLSAQHAEVVVRVFQIAKLGHQALGVERPALDISGSAAHCRLEARQFTCEVLGDAALEVVARHALMICDGCFAPEREARFAAGRIPGTTRTAEVLGRRGVIHRERASGWRNHRLDSLDGIGYVEVRAVQFGDGGVLQLLHPVLECVNALYCAVRVGLQELLRGLNSGAGQDAFRRLRHLTFDPAQLLPAPVIGLQEVHVGAVEGAGGECVAFLADAVLIFGVLHVFFSQKSSHVRVCAGGCIRAGREVTAEGI